MREVKEGCTLCYYCEYFDSLKSICNADGTELIDVDYSDDDFNCNDYKEI